MIQIFILLIVILLEGLGIMFVVGHKLTKYKAQVDEVVNTLKHYYDNSIPEGWAWLNECRDTIKRELDCTISATLCTENKEAKRDKTNISAGLSMSLGLIEMFMNDIKKYYNIKTDEKDTI